MSEEERFPSKEAIEEELEQVNYRTRFGSVLWNTIFMLMVVAAVAVLIAVLLLPVLRIYGDSMNDTLKDGDIVVSIKSSDFETGDLVAFYYNNNILVKRVIAHEGDWVDVDSEGNVYVNQKKIDEPYVRELAFGECDITLPYQVPDSRIFVMGDNRMVSIDSRNTAIGCVAQEQIVGHIVFRVWPLKDFGSVTLGD